MATDQYTDPSEAVTTYTQPTATPTAKVKAVGKAGAITTLLPFLVAVGAFLGFNPEDTETGVNLAVGAIASIVTAYTAISALIQFIAGYMKKSDTANGAVKKVEG